LLASLAPASLVAQATITGQVRGEAGQALPGASVTIADLGAGASVRESGEYSLPSSLTVSADKRSR